MSTNTQLTTIKGTSIAVTGDIESARSWLSRASLFEQGKVFCQVMAGFEIAALWKQAAIQHGGDRKSEDAGSSSHNGKLISREDILESLKLSNTQAYRLMDMSKACASRLKKLPALKDFDPINKPLSLLSDSQKEALTKALHKLTDGQTQREFGESIGLWKKNGGDAGRKRGDGGRPAGPVTPEEVRAAKIKMAVEDLDLAHKAIEALGCKWIVLGQSGSDSEDHELQLTSCLAAVDRLSKALHAWLDKAPANRDPKQITKMFV